MAKASLIAKQKRIPKYKTRYYNRCSLCGRPRGFLRIFGICRICFRNLAHDGHLPGVRKSSF